MPVIFRFNSFILNLYSIAKRFSSLKKIKHFFEERNLMNKHLNVIGDDLRRSLLDSPDKVALIVGSQSVNLILLESVILKALENTGYKCYVIIDKTSGAKSFYRRLSSARILYFSDYQSNTNNKKPQFQSKFKSLSELKRLTYNSG